VIQNPYELVLTPPARRAITDLLPEAVAVAVIDFVTTALLDNPQRVGKPLRDDLSGVWAARRGTYRVLYRINDHVREVVVLRVDHRRDAYRPLS
jgi:mRNA interferase RelE/StbE